MWETARRSAVLGGLYLVQGIVFGFTTIVLVPALVREGVSLEDQAGLLALSSLPWLLKLPVAVALDQLGTSPKRVAAVAMFVMAVVVAAIANVGGSADQARGLGVLWLVLNLLLASQDVAADTLALDTLAKDERGVATGVMWCGHHLGATAIGGMGLGAVVSAASLEGALWVLAGLLALAALLATFAPMSAATRAPKRQRAEDLITILRKPQTWFVGLFAGCVLVADVATSTLSGAFLIERVGWSIEQITQSLPLIILAGNLIGFAVVAAFVDKIGHARACAIGSVLLGGLWIGFGLVPPLWSDVAFMRGFILVQVVVTALMYGGLYAWLMDRVGLRVRATHYAVLTSLLNVPRVWVAALAPALLDAMMFEGTFIAAGSYQVAMAGLLWTVAIRSRRHKPA